MGYYGNRGVDPLDERVAPRSFGQGSPRKALKADAIGPVGSSKVLTIKDFETVYVKSQGRNAAVITFEEYPELSFWVNRPGMTAICERYGDLPRRWIGKVVPLHVVEATNPETDEIVDSLQVAPQISWDQMLGVDEHGQEIPAEKKAAKRRPASSRKK